MLLGDAKIRCTHALLFFGLTFRVIVGYLLSPEIHCYTFSYNELCHRPTIKQSQVGIIEVLGVRVSSLPSSV